MTLSPSGIVLVIALLVPGSALAREPSALGPTGRPTAGVARERGRSPASPGTPLRAPVGRGSSRPLDLAHHEFKTPLDRPTLRKTDGAISDAAFTRKWEASLESPLMFFRSYPSAYYRDLRGTQRSLPGGRGVIFGDAHPDNFGFLKTAGKTEFRFNDFDDAGRGPVALDALRYFTALRLAYPKQDKVFDAALDAYARSLQRPTRSSVPKSLAPDWGVVREKNLEKYTANEGFRFDAKSTRLARAPRGVSTSVRDLVESDPRFGAATVLDVGLRARDGGGSGGLERIWVLVSRGGKSDILELKQTGTPATAALPGGKLPHDTRLDVLKSNFLKAPPHDDLFSVSMGDKHYIVRDRSRMANVATSELSKGDRKRVLASQASVMAAQHRGAWAGVPEKELRAWLHANSDALAGRWLRAFEQAKVGSPPAP